MSRKQKQEALLQNRSNSRVRVGFTMVNPTGLPVPAAKASSMIQLTPIVQPIAMSPYSTQQQLSNANDSDFDDDI